MKLYQKLAAVLAAWLLLVRLTVDMRRRSALRPAREMLRVDGIVKHKAASAGRIHACRQ